MHPDESRVFMGLQFRADHPYLYPNVWRRAADWVRGRSRYLRDRREARRPHEDPEA
jgi:hypothetical protein